MQQRILIVGAGFSGAVLAREFAEAGLRSLIIDQREHIAGNCHTERDEETGILTHVYGPHIFNTNNLEVWQYIQRFCTMGVYVNRVKASTDRGIFSLPINLHTINQFFGKRFGPEEARRFIEKHADSAIAEPANLEEQARKMIGQELYEVFFYGYTKKQWGCEPSELPVELFKRIPIRFNYDDNYYTSRFQGIPIEGYTEIVRRILNHPLIEVRLGARFERDAAAEFEAMFYTGALDAFYEYRFGRLGYRTVFWKKQTESGDFQGNAVLNYPQMTEPFTRVHEHKHFAPWENHEKTVVFTEFSKETGICDDPFYPKRLIADQERYAEYATIARGEKNVFFLGRLATYRYLDMHVVIGEALAFARKFIEWRRSPLLPRPVFSNE